MMFCRCYYSIAFVIFLWLIVDGHLSSPFDIRIDYHRVDTTRDLIINTPRPQFSWKIPFSTNNSERNIRQRSYQIQLIERDHWFEWDTQQIISSQSIHVPYTAHSDLSPSTFYQLRIRIWTTDSDQASEWTQWILFRTSIFNLHHYLTKEINPLWIGSTQINMNELRKEFQVPFIDHIKSAIVYISGIGYYELYLNGKNVDPTRKLDPGWTTYQKRTLLASFDVIDYIENGKNAIGVKLGNGWYSHEQNSKENYGPPRLLFILTITFENGNEMQILSDQTWKGREGSIKHDSLYNGEIYNSQNDRPDWTRHSFNDLYSAWITPEILSSPVNSSLNGSLVLQDMPPIRAGQQSLHFQVIIDDQHHNYLTNEDIGHIEGASLFRDTVLKPIAAWKSDSNVQIFDLGQNFAGWCRVKFRGRSGFGTYIRYGEVLVQPIVSTNHATRNIYTENLRHATASDTYILRGDLFHEIYEPTFTVHGFRYLSISGPPNLLTKDDVECPLVHSETTVIGDFKSNNPIINQVQHNIQWSQLSNSMSLPTDCPQRDERRGWMGDAALTVNEALYNFDLIKFYLNFVNLIVDVQHINGEVPDYVPGSHYPSDPNWGTALPTIVWQLYRHTNDTTILQRYYENVRNYIQYLCSEYNRTGLVNFFSRHGDWVPPSPFNRTNEHLTSSFAFLHDVFLLLNMLRILGISNDTNIYSALYNQLSSEFHRVFYNTTLHFYADGMQSAQILALALPDVVPTDLRSTILDYLVTNITKSGNHETAGIIGTAQLYPVLSDNGYHDLALELISSISYPSYGYMFNNPYENATTIWELWNAPLEGPHMNSRNHHMYGSVGAWFYSHLAGIDLSSEMIIIRPRMASEAKKHLMTKLDCQLSTLYGLVHISYTRDQRDTEPNSIRLRLTIPPNAQARVIFQPLFPGGECSQLIEGNRTIWSEDSSMTDDKTFCIDKDPITNWINVFIGSGHYEFQAMWH